MAGYNELKGLRVKYLSADPANPEDGQVWYNSTTGNLRVQGIGVASFSSGAPLSLARTSNSGINVGTQTAGLAFAGQTSVLTSVVTNTEEYNGSGWSAGGSVNTARGNLAGTGTQTAGLFSSGNTGGPPIGASLSSNVEEYNGSTWTEVNNVSTARADHAGAGPQTSTFIAGGVISPTTITTSTEEYDGTNWTSGGVMPAAREYFSGTGDSTNGLLCGGAPPVYQNTTFLYDGSSWTNGPTLNNGIQSHKTIGTVTDAITLGGATSSTPRVTATEKYDGTSWSSYPATMATGRTSAISAGGSSTAGLLAGGDDGPSAVGATEELNFGSTTVTPAAWSSGGAYPTSLRQNMSFGTQNLALSVGGYDNTSTVSTSASYDGSTWTATPSLNAAARLGGVAGTQSAGLEFGGIQPGGTYSANMQEWNGSTWADNANNLNTGSYGILGFGTATAALKAGGENPGGGNYDAVEEYNGSAWTTVTAMPESKYVGAGNGIQTSGLIAGGNPSGTSTLEYNGSTWAAGGSLMTSRPGIQAGSAGTTSDSNIIFGGNAPPGVINDTEGYDGIAWSTRPSLATGRGSTNGNGTASLGLMVCGGPPSGTTTTVEEFTGETVSANPASNLSVS
jgi:hypothetical protein